MGLYLWKDCGHQALQALISRSGSLENWALWALLGISCVTLGELFPKLSASVSIPIKQTALRRRPVRSCS